MATEHNKKDGSTPHLDRNLSVLRKRRPDLADLLERADAAKVCPVSETGPFRRAMENLLRSGKAEVIYVSGVGQGDIAAEVFERTREGFGPEKTPIGLVFLEHRPEMFRAMLSLNDRTQLLESKRTFFCVGEDLDRQCREIQTKYRLCACPHPGHFQGRCLNADEVGIYQVALRDLDESRARFQHRFQAQLAELQQKFRSRPAQIRKIWSSVGLADRAVQHIIRGLMEALQRKGFEIRILEIDPEEYQPPWYCLMDICEYQPDLIVQANFPSSLLFPRELALHLAIPRVVWYVDSPRNFWQQQPSFFFTTHDHVFVWDEAYLDFLRSLGAERVEVLPYAADIQAPLEPEDRFRSPLSFVGQVVDQSEVRKRLSPPEREFLDRLIELRLQDTAADVPDLLARIRREQRQILSSFSTQIHLPSFLYAAANARHRIRVLESVVQYGLKLYGPESWLTVMDEDSPLRGCFCGPVDHRTEFPAVIRSSTINLNIHSLHALGSMNMRDFDVPLQDGFLLTDWVSGADRFFVPDVEMVFWKGCDDLKRKIEWYLAHPDERAAIIAHGKARVLKDHTYDARAGDLLRCMGMPGEGIRPSGNAAVR